MATLDRKKTEKQDDGPTLASVADAMRAAKEHQEQGEADYKKYRKDFLALMGEKSKLETDKFVYSISRPVKTTFDAEQMITDHPEASFLVTKTEIVTTVYELDEEAANKAIEADEEGLVLDMIQEYVTETPESPRVSIKVVNPGE